MTPDEIRAEVIAVAAKEIASWESDPNPNSRHFACGEGIANRLAAAGLLPTRRRTRFGSVDGEVAVVEEFVTPGREVVSE